MGIIEKVTTIEKRIARLAARHDVPLQPLEIRRAVLDEIEDLVPPSRTARRVFPFTRIVVEVVAAPSDRVAMAAKLGEASGLREAIEDRLRQSGCPVPRDLALAVKLVRRPAGDWETGRVFRVMCDRPEKAAATVEPSPAAISILKGDAPRKTYSVRGERTNIGRLAEVIDRDHRVVRRNQVVFAETDNPVNLTVSRAHAHITVTAAGEYRLFDDRSTHGTRIFRRGRTIALPSGSPRGTRLQSGDEIYFGQACAKFEIG